MTIKNIIDANQCTGCMACSFVCPKSAISYPLNDIGFYEPFINETKCIKCGKCFNVCKNIKSLELNPIQQTYYGWSKDEKIRKSSSSGGAFYEIAKKFIENGGVVYGAYLKKPINLKHARIASIENLYKLQGSKYIQSDISNTFKEIKKDLDNGYSVLFSGTPCQVAAIKYLFNTYNNLLTIDLVCFGFISNGAYQLYLKAIEMKHRTTIKSVVFRDQYNNNKMKIELNSGKTIFCDFKHNPKDDIYIMFLDRYAVKRICNKCPFSSSFRCGDISLSDYPYFISNKIDQEENGVSVVYLNSQKGKGLVVGTPFHMYKTDNSLIEHFVRNLNLDVIINKEKFFKSIYKTSLKHPKYMIKFCDSIRRNKQSAKFRILLSKIKYKFLK